MALVRRDRPNVSPRQNWDLENYGELFNDFDRLFGHMASPTATTNYPIDLYETDDSLVLEMAVPGVKGEELDVSIEGRQLTIRGTVPDPHEQEGQQRRYWLHSIPHGQFSRTITLPTTVESDNVEANVRDGLLVLTMPKVAEAKAKKIQVQTS